MLFWRRKYECLLHKSLAFPGPTFLQVQMALSASVHTRATGTWPTTISTASGIMVQGAIVPSSPASMGTASQSSGNVTTSMTVVTAVTSWKLSVVSWTLGTFVKNSQCAKCLVLLEVKNIYSENLDLHFA